MLRDRDKEGGEKKEKKEKKERRRRERRRSTVEKYCSTFFFALGDWNLDWKVKEKKELVRSGTKRHPKEKKNQKQQQQVDCSLREQKVGSEV